ncbi:cyclase family protein [Nakamurella endophytica]|uniref:cyclase family protein n=1 Tax=Nakamurella endophytica TaxID=1748367 RepID=UPI00166847CE|nr:cyclase family protein [Nakamurella endophytica]
MALTLSVRPGGPSYPGDPAFAVDPAFVDTRGTPGGYLVEQVTRLGTHTASHVSAPAHLVPGGRTLAELTEDLALLPLAVVDVRHRIRRQGPHFRVDTADLQEWERHHGPVPARGCVLLLTGAAELFHLPGGEQSPYVTTPVPGFSGDAVDWLFDRRGVLGVGADSLGPDATSDPLLEASTRALRHGGWTVENVGPGLARMRQHGDWLAVNGNRPALSGFPVGLTGFTVRR